MESGVRDQIRPAFILLFVLTLNGLNQNCNNKLKEFQLDKSLKSFLFHRMQNQLK